MTTTRRKIPNVTLVAVGNTQVEGMKKALEYSCQGVEWGEVLLIQPELNDIDDWSRYIVFELGQHITTDYALLVHPDGFVVHPEVWDWSWLNYDFIGSPFPLPTDNYSYRGVSGQLHRVGNSVSLRSKRLLDLPKELGMEWRSWHGNYNEDGYVSVNMRHVFEDAGCKYAPLEVAAKFGREVPIPENENIDTFVFHKHAGRNSKYPNFEQ